MRACACLCPGWLMPCVFSSLFLPCRRRLQKNNAILPHFLPARSFVSKSPLVQICVCQHKKHNKLRSHSLSPSLLSSSFSPLPTASLGKYEYVRVSSSTHMQIEVDTMRFRINAFCFGQLSCASEGLESTSKWILVVTEHKRRAETYTHTHSIYFMLLVSYA